MSNFRPKGIKSCAFCTNLGKYITNGRYYCSLDSQVEFEAVNSGGQQPAGFICDKFSEGRKQKETDNGVRNANQIEPEAQKT